MVEPNKCYIFDQHKKTNTMYYKVKLKDPKPETSTPEGYLSNWIDLTQPALYTRGEAIKKAFMFDGKIEKAENIPTVTSSSMVIVSGNDLLFGVRTFLKFRDLYGSTDIENINCFIYDGGIFRTILLELEKLEKENDDFKIKDEIRIQLNELTQTITSEYVLIKDMCFS